MRCPHTVNVNYRWNEKKCSLGTPGYLHINVIHSHIVEHLWNTRCNIFTRTIKMGLSGNKTFVASIYHYYFLVSGIIIISVWHDLFVCFKSKRNHLFARTLPWNKMRLTQRANQDTRQNMCVNLPREPFINCVIDKVFSAAWSSDQFKSNLVLRL